MNESAPSNSVLSEKNSSAASQKDKAVATSSRSTDGQPTAPRSTYESLFWLFNYIRMFTSRLARDLYVTLLGHFYDPRDLVPGHIAELMRVQKNLRAERQPHSITYSSSRERQRLNPLRIPMRKYFNAFKSYVLSSEDDSGFQFGRPKDYASGGVEREPMFVIVDSSCASNPSSKELLIDNRNCKNDTILRRYFNKHVKLVDTPSTSRDLMCDMEIITPQLKESESRDELQMVAINLQSENDILSGEVEHDDESIVISYLKNKDALLDLEGTLLSSKKKASLLESVPKMETILEELSDTYLDAHIPSYPGSPRSFDFNTSRTSLYSLDERNPNFKEAIKFLHQDHDFLIAAETSDEEMLHTVIRKGTDIQHRDHLGRNALHLAVCSNNLNIIKTLLSLGVDPNVKDSVGMTPLSLCLMRRPSSKVAKLLFDHGAVLMPRVDPMDTGLFLQFVIMCIPTEEEERILYLLVEKGAVVNDPKAPGGRQAMHFAAMSNNCELIEILLDLGADSNVTNHRNETPKEVALTFRCKEAYDLLESYYDTSSIQSGGSRYSRQNSNVSNQSMPLDHSIK